ncbi:MAG: phenylalanine--tRNA ligase subunit beta [Puniceicoccales bacterium]|jgi:phenylalanyl-tRNA synthetase beta chain|nr:phenylalanine--tRNA ligase subunit beta [Puniceicoccales bacterium]
MKISVRWLNRYLNLEVADDELAEIFTSIGLEVEGIEKIGVSRQKTLVIGEIQQIDPHPNADKLSVCRVCVGQDDVRQIVCGAKNFQLNDHVPVALPGTILPGDFKISKSNLRGIDSDGMMCSGKELGLSDDHLGLLILPGESKVGKCLHDEIKIHSDTIFDLSLTANRGDCLSYIGVARDVAAKLSMELKLPEIVEGKISEVCPSDHFMENISIETDNCECYSAICIKNIKIGSSPDWMKNDLAAAGIRSINNAVDVGNWVMMETGQPVHIFDAKKIHGNRLVIRQAKDGETVTSLDGKQRILDHTMMVICDGERPLVIAGVTGSIDAEVDTSTVDILIESAYFNPDNIRQTAKDLNVSTESSHRFSRDIDTANVAQNCQRVAHLIGETCGGEIVSCCWKVGSPKRQTFGIDFDPSSIEKLCGFAIPFDISEKILTNLGFKVEKIGEKHWQVTVPAHRPDITCPADVVSECLRIYGTDKIPSVAVRGMGIHRNTDQSVAFTQKASNYLSNHEFFECYNLSLRNQREMEQFMGEGSVLAMQNPLSADQNCFRNSLIPGLLESLRLNIQNGNCDGKFFEVGRVVLKIDGQFNECLAVSCLMPAKPMGRSWRSLQECDFYDIKALIIPILKNFSQELSPFSSIKLSGLWQSAYAAYSGSLSFEKVQATCGMLSLDLLKKFDIKQNILAAEIIVHPSIFSRKLEKESHKPFSQFPRVSKDISLVVKLHENAATVENNVMKAAQKNAGEDIFIESTNVFDIYTGTENPEGRKSIGVTINYRSDRRTLTDTEVQTAFSAAQKDIEKLYEVRKQI